MTRQGRLRFSLVAGMAAVLQLAVMPAASADPSCQCVANGKRVSLGTVVCLEVGSSTRYLARCDRVLNNTSWKKLQDDCPLAAAPPSDRLAHASLSARKLPAAWLQ